MNEVFCTSCNHTGLPQHQMSGGIVVIGILGGLASVILLAGGLYSCSFVCFLVSGVFIVAGYNSRNYFCAFCGSTTFLPANAPKAIEFRNRNAAFEHIHDNLERRFPESQGEQTSTYTIPGPRRSSSSDLP
jgi:hypothetical protein